MSKQRIRIFEGGVAIITGGASGIGRALGKDLAKRGAEVVLADLYVKPVQQAIIEIQSIGGKATAAQVDVTDFQAVNQLVRETVGRTGRLDYMFNNAGIAIVGAVRHYQIDDWNRIIDVNLRGVTNGVQAAYQVMMEQQFGHIVNTASMAGLIPLPKGVGYTTTKHAVVGLSTSLRTEAALEGIRVSVLCPGVIRTSILEGGRYGKILNYSTPEQLKSSWERFRPISADVFARKALDAIAQNKPIIVIPFWWKFLWWLNRLSPSLGIFAVQRSSSTQ